MPQMSSVQSPGRLVIRSGITLPNALGIIWAYHEPWAGNPVLKINPNLKGRLDVEPCSNGFQAWNINIINENTGSIFIYIVFIMALFQNGYPNFCPFWENSSVKSHLFCHRTNQCLSQMFSHSWWLNPNVSPMSTPMCSKSPCFTMIHSEFPLFCRNVWRLNIEMSGHVAHFTLSESTAGEANSGRF